MSTRLGVVSYFNARPLVHALASGALPHGFELLYDVPSRCADRLHAGRTDVALIPSIEIAACPGAYCVVPQVAIASRGPVRSVLLVLGDDPENIRTLAVDSGSRTSVALARVLLQKRYHRRPSVTVHPPDVGRMLAAADAAVLIGDAALELDTARYRVLDLGEAWTDLTGLPFVYACWTGRTNALTAQEARLLVRARDRGLADADAIARAYAADRANTADFYRDYLLRRIAYGLGDDEAAGLRTFYRYAEEMGLILHRPRLRFFPVD